MENDLPSPPHQEEVPPLGGTPAPPAVPVQPPPTAPPLQPEPPRADDLPHAPAPDEPMAAAVRAALPDGHDGYVDIELGTNIGTAVVAHEVIQNRGYEAIFCELGGELAASDADEHVVRVPVADEAAVRAIAFEVLTSI